MALTFNVLNLETALRSAHARAGHTWFQAMTAVPMARLSVILRALRVEARRQVCPGPGSIGTAGAGRHPRADPAASHARPVLRQGIARPGRPRWPQAALSGAAEAAPVLLGLSCQTRRSRSSTEAHE